jgi:hypothetical protein
VLSPARVQLSIVATRSVHPHEIADPGREAGIEKRLRADGVLRDPLIVGSVRGMDGFVLLDGTNRKRALAALGLPNAMVQIVDYADENAVRLGTWCHGVEASIDRLIAGVRTIPELAARPVGELGATDALREPSVLALVLSRDDQCAVVRSPGVASWTGQLRQLVDLYEEKLTRVDCSAEDVEERAQSLPSGQCLVAFPRFSRSQVVTMAMRGSLIPAGITRHVILAGRALRVNLPLESLSDSLSLGEANALLDRHAAGLQPRVYQEPTILFDS